MREKTPQDKNFSWNEKRPWTKRMFPDWLLCTMVCAALTGTILAGFDGSDPLLSNPVAIAGMSLLIIGILEALQRFGKGNLAVILISLLSVLGVFLTLFHNNEASVFELSVNYLGIMDQNPNLFPAVTMLSAILVFWTVRTRVGICLLFLGGSFLSAFFDVLGYPISARELILFLSGCLALWFLRITQETTQQDTLPWNSMLQIVVTAAVIICLAAGLFFGAVRPLSPSNAKDELSGRLMNLPLMEQLGIVSTKTIYTDSPIPPEIKKEQQQEEKKKPDEEKKASDRKEMGRIGNDLNLAAAAAVTFKAAAKAVWVVVPALIFLMAAAVPVRRILRRRWYQKVLTGSREQGVELLYAYFLKRLGRVGLKRPQDMTLSEFAEDAREALKDFAVYDADFMRLTHIYQGVIYGGQRVSEKEFELFQDFYMVFLKNLRGKIGCMKYLFAYFVL